MLCQFSFKNFKSYRDEAVLDMQATNIEEFSDSLIPSPNRDKFSNILPVAAIYGPNGGGKSVLLEAFAYLVARIMSPIRSAKAEKANPFFFTVNNAAPFLMDDTSEKEPMCFQVYFRTELAEFRYELSVCGKEIVYEALYRTKLETKRVSPVMIFERDHDIELGTAMKQAKVVLPKDFNASLPMLSFAYYSYDISEINEAIGWFKKCYMINYSNGLMESMITLFESQESRESFLSLLDRFGIPIKDYQVSEIKDDNGDTHRRIYTAHEINGKTYMLPLHSESQGTFKLFSLLPLAIVALEAGGVTIVDELDAKLHPQLLRAAIRLFTNPETNPNHAQLIFVSQDVSTMRSEFLRRDEIWFAARDDESVSRLWSLYDLQDARGERVKTSVAYDKQYLEGRYGADPYLKQMMDWRIPNAKMSEKAEEK